MTTETDSIAYLKSVMRWGERVYTLPTTLPDSEPNTAVRLFIVRGGVIFEITDMVNLAMGNPEGYYSGVIIKGEMAKKNIDSEEDLVLELGRIVCKNPIAFYHSWL